MIAVLWVLLAAIGTPRGTLPQRWKGKAHSAVCGACGHPAVELGRIGRCPECGTEYEKGGVLTRAAAVRLGPPFAVVVLLVAWAGVMGWVYLVPWAAGEANRRTIGARDVQVIERRATLEQDTSPLMIQGFEAGQWKPDPGYSLSITQSLVRPDWPLVTGDNALNDDPRVRVSLVRKTGGEFVLLWSPESDRWTLLEKIGAELDRGHRLDVGIRAMFAAADDPQKLLGKPFVGEQHHQPTVDRMRRNEIADAIQYTGELAGKQMVGRIWNIDDGGLVGLAGGGVQVWPNMLHESITTHRSHELAPAGTAAAVATRVLIIGAGLAVLVAIALLRRRVLAEVRAPAGDGNPGTTSG